MYNSNRYNSNTDPVNEPHIFAQTPFSNYVELTNLLKNNIIYFKDGKYNISLLLTYLV